MSRVLQAVVEDVSGRNSRTIEITPPVRGPRRQWSSINDFTLDLFRRIANGEQLFENEDGSDATIVVDLTSIGINDVRLNTVLSQMHVVYHEASNAQRQNGVTLASLFKRKYGYDLVAADSGRSPFRVVLARAVVLPSLSPPIASRTRAGTSTIADRTRSSSSSGVRRGNISFRSISRGTVVDVRKIFDGVSDRLDLLYILEKSREWCFEIKDASGVWCRNTPADTIESLRRMACVPLGLWLRFSKSPLADAILKKLRIPIRTGGNIGHKFPRKIASQGPRLAWFINSVLARHRNIRPRVHWVMSLGDPVTDVELYSLAVQMGIDIHVIQNDAYRKYNNLLGQDGHNNNAAIIMSSERAACEQSVKDVQIMLRFNGVKDIKEDKDVYRNRNGYKVMMVCHSIMDTNAHAEFVLNPVTEANMFGNSYTKMHYDMVYDSDLDKTQRTKDGYFSRLVQRRVDNKLVAKTRYSTMDKFDLDTIVRNVYKRSVVLIDTEEEFDTMIGNVISTTGNLFDNGCQRDGIDYSVLGNTIYIDSALLSDLAGALGHNERDTSGMRYVMGDLYNRFVGAGLESKVDFSEFVSTDSTTRAATLFRYKADGTADQNCATSFGDVNSFTFSLMAPIEVQKDVPTSIEQTTPFTIAATGKRKAGSRSNKRTDSSVLESKRKGVSNLFTIKIYSKKEYNNALIHVKTRPMRSKIKDIAAVLRKEFLGPNPIEEMELIKMADEIVEKVLSDSTTTRIAMAIAKVSVFMCIVGEKKGFVNKCNEHFGAFPSVADGITRVHAPQIDEPVPSIGVINSRATPIEDTIEMDASQFYPQVLLGKFDHMYEKDFYGGKFVFAAPKHAMVSVFEQDDFLGSYEADLGDVWIENIEFDVVRTKLGLSELNSWNTFSSNNLASVGRRVPCASVIHFTSQSVEELKKRHRKYKGRGVRPWLYEHKGNDIELWKAFQSIVFNIKLVYFHHEQDVRKLIKRMEQDTKSNDRRSFFRVNISGQRAPRNESDEYSLLGGHLNGQQGDNAMIDIRKGLSNAYREEMSLYTGVGSGMDLDTARKTVKSEINKSIGFLKYGKVGGGLTKRTKSDMVEARNDINATKDLVIENIPFADGYSTEFCVRELPGTDLTLVERVLVAPVVVNGYPRELRRMILETARLVMDILIDVSNAYMVKTDAIFFSLDKLKSVVAFVNESFPGRMQSIGEEGWGDFTAGDIIDSDAECRQNGCALNKYCREHCPLDIDVMDMGKIPPFKFTYHHGHGGDVSDVDKFFSVDGLHTQEKAACGVERASTVLLKLSETAKKIVEQSLVVADEPQLVYASSCMPTVEEMLMGGMMTTHACQTLGNDPTPEMSPLELHCHLNNINDYIFIGGEGSAQPMTVDNDKRNAFYMDKLIKLMVSYDGGFKMEGCPGMGKSYTIHEFVKNQLYTDKNALIFVATATHLSLKPYKVLDKWEEEQLQPGDTRRITTCTVHSLVGIFNQLKKVASDPHSWFKSNDSRFMSNLYRTFGKNERSADCDLTPIWIIIDEYEMLQQGFEEIILYMSKLRGVNIILLGDKMQTAAPFGVSIRCEGDVVKTVTRNRCIVFDLPFRNPDYEYQLAHKKACEGHPTMFLKYPLSNYVCVPTRLHSSYTLLMQDTADAYLLAAENNKVYSGRVIAVQNHKVGCVVTLDILELIPEESGFVPSAGTPFVGSSACCMGEQSTGELGTVDDDLVESGSNVESWGKRMMGIKIYSKRYNHNATGESGPSSTGFYVGTMMTYKLGYSYRATKAFTPKTHRIENGEKLKPMAVGMGSVMMLCSLETQRVKLLSENNKVRMVDIEFGTFVGEDGDKTILRMEEMRAYMYYPFCLYTGGVVGHTYDNYTMVKLSQRGQKRWDYAEMKPQLEKIEKVCGDVSYVIPAVKTLNVAASRVTKGNRANIIEVMDGRQGFWRETVFNSSWHAVSLERYDMYIETMCEMRGVAKSAQDTLVVVDGCALRSDGVPNANRSTFFAINLNLI